MAISQQLQDFAKRFAQKMVDEHVAIFAGAGLSAGVGFVNWSELLAPFANELDLDIVREKDHLVRLAQFSKNYKGGNRHHLNQALISAFPVFKEPSENHKVLARLPIDTYWTTNYDKLIETSLHSIKKKVDVKHTDSQLPTSTPRRDAVVYKMHGDVEHPDEAVLTRDDYESYSKKHPGFLNALTGEMTGKTFLFVGFSFADPNIEYILSEIRQRFDQAQREHFCLLKKPKVEDFSNVEDFHYAVIRQRHFIADLRRFNISVLEMEEYSDVHEVLIEIERSYRRRSVFVGGSAEEYTPWGEEGAENFFRALGALLVDMDFRVVSGFGLGVGNALISGAIDHAYSKGNLHLDSFLDVRPFPRAIADSDRRAAVWKTYREDLLKIPGIAIFFLGNKLVQGQLINADGMKMEFDIACDQGVIPIPVGGTGSMAAELATMMLADFAKYCPDNDLVIKEYIEKLTRPVKKLEEYLSDIKALLEHVVGK